jgi:hypothetical protein
MHSVDLAQDRGRCRALVNVVLDFWVPKMRRVSWLVEGLLASQEGLLYAVSLIKDAL